MKVAIIVLCCLSALPYVFALIGHYYQVKQLGKLDNKDPRGQYTQLRGPGARAVAAQQNAWEALAIYGAALLAVVASGLEVKYLAEAAIIVLIARLLHGVFYLTNLDKLRSLAFMVAVVPCFYLFYVVIAVF